jgi:nucleoside-diphosphate-sugar epimerase
MSVLRYLAGKTDAKIVGFSRNPPAFPPPGDFEFIAGDVTDACKLTEVLRTISPQRIIHLAGLQTPDCQSTPFRGMNVNMVSTAKMFEIVAKELPGLVRFVFASSVAVHGPRAAHPQPKLGSDALFCPSSLYAFWKIAGEGAAQAFHMETKVPTVSLRLATTYGPGRDRGMTSAPTTALKSVVLGEDFEIPYSGQEHYHFVDDVGAGFALAAVAPFEGYGVFHLPGETFPIQHFCDTVNQVAQGIPGLDAPGKAMIKEGAPVVPFASDLDHAATIRAFPGMPLTPLGTGIRKSLEIYLEKRDSEVHGGVTPNFMVGLE